MFDPPFHPFIVRSLPLDTIAICAQIELVEGFPHAWRNTAGHILFLHPPKERVAGQTPDERMDQRKEIEPLYNFDCLFAGLVFADQIRMRERWTLNHPPVFAQQRSLLVEGNTLQLVIIVGRTVEDIKPEQPKVTGQLAEMDVEHEARSAQRAFPHLLHGGNIKRFEDRIDADAVSLLNVMLKTDRAAIDKDKIHFKKWDPCRLNEAADGRLFPGLV